MSSATRIVLAGDPELLVVLGAFAPEPDGPPTVVWLDAGEQPPGSLRSCDRLIATDPGTAGAWRTLPLPVADAHFASTPLSSPAGRVRWVGPDGPRRQELLRRQGEAAAWPAGHGLAVNLPEEGRTWVTHELAAALAAGCLLVSETLSPALGLEPGVDYLEARDLDDLFVATQNALRRPQAFRRIQLAGRRKAEWLRASTQLARVAHDLRRELAATS